LQHDCINLLPGSDLDVAKHELAFLGESERAWIFGETALSVYTSLKN
jgi:hypothetical protein